MESPQAEVLPPIAVMFGFGPLNVILIMSWFAWLRPKPNESPQKAAVNTQQDMRLSVTAFFVNSLVYSRDLDWGNENNHRKVR
jgi:hypothetical protein